MFEPVSPIGIGERPAGVAARRIAQGEHDVGQGPSLAVGHAAEDRHTFQQRALVFQFEQLFDCFLVDADLFMIDFVPASHDDPKFLALVQRIVNGAVEAMQVSELFLVHIDNWFDHKWLRFWSWNREGELRVPPFNPNRVCSEKRFVRNPDTAGWAAIEVSKPLHIREPGRSQHARLLDRFSKRAAFVWYSGNTAKNTLGSLMFYLTGAEGYSWYASFRKAENWTIADGFGISPHDLVSFADRGQVENLPYDSPNCTTL